MPSLQIVVDECLSDDGSLQEKMTMLECLDELQSQAYLNMTTIQQWHKTYYDNKMKSNTFLLMI